MILYKKGLVEEVKEPEFFSLMADEVESHHTEQFPVCLATDSCRDG